MLNKNLKLNMQPGSLTNLQRLDLDESELKEIPKEIGFLINLKLVYLDNNQLKEIQVLEKN